MAIPVQPLLMPPNLLEHFYRGGANIAALRGIETSSSHNPEEWLASTAHRWGEEPAGLSSTAHGLLLRDLIAADPSGWLGPDGAQAGFSGDTGILVKLLDAGQRLPVHVHPDRPFARDHLRSMYGKTEAWHVLATEGEDPAVWLGFTSDIDPVELASRVDAQDSEWMLGQMHKISVRPGDSILVPGGTAHAIGSGVFVMEIQEPTDLSILLEWSVTTSSRAESHLGLGFDTALRAVNHRALPVESLNALQWRPDMSATSATPIRAFPSAADDFFRLALLVPPEKGATGVAAGFAVVMLTDGHGTISPARTPHGGDEFDVGRGDVIAMPAGYGDWKLSGTARALLCQPSAGWPSNLTLPAVAGNHATALLTAPGQRQGSHG